MITNFSKYLLSLVASFTFVSPMFAQNISQAKDPKNTGSVQQDNSTKAGNNTVNPSTSTVNPSTSSPENNSDVNTSSSSSGRSAKDRRDAIAGKSLIDRLIGKWINENKETGQKTTYEFKKDENSEKSGTLSAEYRIDTQTSRNRGYEESWKFELSTIQNPIKPIDKINRIEMSLVGGTDIIRGFYEIYNDSKEFCLLFSNVNADYPNKFEKETCQKFLKLESNK